MVIFTCETAHNFQCETLKVCEILWKISKCEILLSFTFENAEVKFHACMFKTITVSILDIQIVYFTKCIINK